MKVAVVGLGAVGLPFALALASRDHTVAVHDKCRDRALILKSLQYPTAEAGVDELLARKQLQCVELDKALDGADMVFVAADAPPSFDARQPLPAELPAFDVDHTQLRSTVREVVKCVKADASASKRVLAVITWTSVGYIEKELLPLLESDSRLTLCYTPLFTQLGSVIKDTLEPEFFLIGSNDKEATQQTAAFLVQLNASVPVVTTAIRDAEMIRETYSAFLSTKEAFACTVGQLCDWYECDADVVTNALLQSKEKLFGAHRFKAATAATAADAAVAASTLQRLTTGARLQSAFAGGLLRWRDDSASWAASLLVRYGGDLPKVVLGTASARDLDVDHASYGLLVAQILLREFGEKSFTYDPCIHDAKEAPLYAAAFLVAVNHSAFASFAFSAGSVVVDPWRVVRPQPGVTLHSIGRGSAPQRAATHQSGKDVLRSQSVRVRARPNISTKKREP